MNIYLICSSSINLLDEEVKKIIKDNPYSTFDLNNSELDDVLEEASYFSLFDEKKYMVVKNATVFAPSARKKKEEDEEETVSKKDEKLLSYLNTPNTNTVLIFTLNGKCDSKKKICKIVKDRYNLINIAELKKKEIHDKAIKLLKDEKYKIDSNLMYYIIDNCNSNYDLVVQELEKIKLYYLNPCEIKEKDVRNIISKVIEDNNFKFIDTVLKKDIKESFKIYDDLMIQKVEPIMLLSMLAKEIRNILLIKKLLQKKDRASIKSILGINYDFQLDKLINESYSFKEKELENYLLSLCDIDYKIKTGKISNKLALQMFILKICN